MTSTPQTPRSGNFGNPATNAGAANKGRNDMRTETTPESSRSLVRDGGSAHAAGASAGGGRADADVVRCLDAIDEQTKRCRSLLSARSGAIAETGYASSTGDEAADGDARRNSAR